METGFCYGSGFETEFSDVWNRVPIYRHLHMTILNGAESRVENSRVYVCSQSDYLHTSRYDFLDRVPPGPSIGRGHLLCDAFRLCRLDKESEIWVLMGEMIWEAE